MTPENTVECEACQGSGKIVEEARTIGANQHSACQMDCDDCDGSGRAPTPQEQPDGHTKGPDEALLVTGFYGMKCDAEGCGWSDMTVPRSAYPDYLNAPCPSCGATLLTDEDWQLVLNMEAAEKWVRANAVALGLGEATGPVVTVDFDDVKAALCEAAAIAKAIGQ